MSYQDPNSFKKWGGILDPEDETDPNLPLFNWDDVDLAHPVESPQQSHTALIEISMYEDIACSQKATHQALQRFLDISKCDPSDVKYTRLDKKEKNILFSSIKIVYTVQVTACKDAAMAYHRNKKKVIP